MCVQDVCGFSSLTRKSARECCRTHAETTFTQWEVNGMRLNGLPATPHQCLKAFPVM